MRLVDCPDRGAIIEYDPTGDTASEFACPSCGAVHDVVDLNDEWALQQDGG